MDRQLWEWKVSVERIWSAAAPDYRQAARLAADIASASEQAMLRLAAAQALPILRSASAEDAERTTRDAARRRLGVIREVLHSLTSPQLGKRRHALDLNEHRRVRQRPHHTCRARGIRPGSESGSIKRIHGGDIGRAR